MAGDTVTFTVSSGSYGDSFTWYVCAEEQPFSTDRTASYTFPSADTYTVTLEATEEGCPKKVAEMKITVGEYHDDNCFIATSAASATGFFSLAALLAGLAGAVAWRKRR
jgi:MYXO-CTERM domain-containing protein